MNQVIPFGYVKTKFFKDNQIKDFECGSGCNQESRD